MFTTYWNSLFRTIFHRYFLMAQNSRKRRVRISSHGLGSETLELRQLLAADLTVANQALVSVEPLGANVHIASQLVIPNIGNMGIIANNVHLEGVLSADQIFGNADDLLLDLDLIDLNLLPGTIANGSISGNVSLPNYLSKNFLLIKIDSDDALNEGSEINNVASITLPELPTLTTSVGQTTGKTNRAIRIDPGITFADSPSQNFDGGSLHVAVEGDVGDNNVLSVKRIKTENGILRRKQNELRIGSQVVATVAGGTNAAPLVITFTNEIGVNEIEAIASAVTLRGKRNVPGVRNVQFFVAEPTVVTGFTAEKQVALTT